MLADEGTEAQSNYVAHPRHAQLGKGGNSGLDPWPQSLSSTPPPFPKAQDTFSAIKSQPQDLTLRPRGQSNLVLPALGPDRWEQGFHSAAPLPAPSSSNKHPMKLKTSKQYSQRSRPYARPWPLGMFLDKASLGTKNRNLLPTGSFNSPSKRAPVSRSHHKPFNDALTALPVSLTVPSKSKCSSMSSLHNAPSQSTNSESALQCCT